MEPITFNLYFSQQITHSYGHNVTNWLDHAEYRKLERFISKIVYYASNGIVNSAQSVCIEMKK